MKNFARCGALAVTLFFFALMMSNMSCKKTSLEANVAASAASSGFVSSCGAPLNGSTVVEVIRNDHDPADDKITLIQYHYARAIRQAMKNASLRCIMVNALISDATENGVSVLSLAQNNSTLAAAINAELRASINATGSETLYPRGTSGETGIDALRGDANWDANSFLRNKMVYASEQYEPAIYFMKKPASCEVGGPITVLIGQDVDDCDDVAGWQNDDEVVMSESDVRAASGIVLMVGPNKIVYQPLASNPNQTAAATEVTERSSVDIDIISHQVKAGFRFESSGKSDLRGWIIVSDNLTKTAEDGGEITKISKDDIAASKVFGPKKDFYTISQSLYDSKNQFFGVYEFDWWATNKTISNTCTGFAKSARMKFATEFYFKHCAIQPLGPLVITPQNTAETLPVVFPTVSSNFTLKGVLQ